MTNFAVLLQICGVSVDAAALYLGVPRRVVIRWSRGGGAPTDEALNALGALHARQQDVADAIITSWDEAGRPPEMTIATARDDAEAQSMGWPSLAAQTAPAAIAQAVLAPIRVTLESCAAAAPAAVDDAAPNAAGIAAE